MDGIVPLAACTIFFVPEEHPHQRKKLEDVIFSSSSVAEKPSVHSVGSRRRDGLGRAGRASLPLFATVSFCDVTAVSGGVSGFDGLAASVRKQIVAKATTAMMAIAANHQRQT